MSAASLASSACVLHPTRARFSQAGISLSWPAARALENLVRTVDRLAIKPVIDAIHPLDELPSALDGLDRGSFGEVVIDLA